MVDFSQPILFQYFPGVLFVFFPLLLFTSSSSLSSVFVLFVLFPSFSRNPPSPPETPHLSSYLPSILVYLCLPLTFGSMVRSLLVPPPYLLQGRNKTTLVEDEWNRDRGRRLRGGCGGPTSGRVGPPGEV